MHGPSFDSCRCAERVVALAVDVVADLRVPGARVLPAMAVEDVRADAVAAVWRAALRAPEGFLDERGGPDPGAIAAYATCWLRKGVDEVRRERRSRDAAIAHALEADGSGDATIDALLAQEDESLLTAAIERLSAPAAAVVRRRRLGWSFERIAGDLGIKRNTAIQRYRRALRRLPADARSLLPPQRHRGR